MDSFIQFVIRNVKAISISVVILLIFAGIVSFFVRNTIVVLSVNAEGGDGLAASVLLDDKPVKEMKTGSTSILVASRDSIYIKVDTDEYSTIQQFTAPIVIGSLEINLKKHAKTTMVGSNIKDCAYERSNFLIDWGCDEPLFDARKRSYSENSFPTQSQIDIPSYSYEYAVKYKSGLIAVSDTADEGGLWLTYIDLQSGEAKVKDTYDLDDRYFKYETTVHLVDQSNTGDILAIDQDSLHFVYFKDGLSNPSSKGVLPTEFKRSDDGYATYSFENGTLSSFQGLGYDDLDDHSGNVDSTIESLVKRYSIKSKDIEVTNLGLLRCTNAVEVSDTVACEDRDIVSFYKSNDLSNPILQLANTSTIFTYDNEIYTAQGSSVYKYSTSDNNLVAVFKVNDRVIGDSYIANGELYVTSWFLNENDTQFRLLYKVDLDEYEDNPVDVKSFPLPVSSDIAYSVDLHNNTLYVILADSSEETKDQMKKIIEDNGLSGLNVIYTSF